MSGSTISLKQSIMTGHNPVARTVRYDFRHVWNYFQNWNRAANTARIPQDVNFKPRTFF